MTSQQPPRGGADTDADPSGTIVRRAPFASNPQVGVRGQKTQERILRAALEVFGDVGYHACGIQQITELSGCSRVSFYQYFSSKEDLFRHLAGRVAKELHVSADAIGSITGDQAGWEAMRAWLDRYSEIYDVYEPVFLAFQAAVASDEAVASGSARVATRSFTSIRALITGSSLAPRQIDGVIHTLLAVVSPSNRMVTLLEAATPGERGWRKSQLNVALADVFHRALFGPDPAVNVHQPRRRARPQIAVTTDPRSVDAGGGNGETTFGPAATRTRSLLLESALEVFGQRGYYGTRVADIVSAAEVSHGLFYRYFDSKADIFQILSDRAVERVQGMFDEFPFPLDGDGDAPSDKALRGWLQRFDSAFAGEASIIAMWIEAMSRGQGDDLTNASVTAIEGGRRALARALRARPFGDPDTEAIVLLVCLFAMVAGRRSPARVESYTQLIERGLLAPPAS